MVGIDDGLADAKAESCPTSLSVTVGFDAIEAVEEVGKMLGWDASALVCHPKDNLISMRPAA